MKRRVRLRYGAAEDLASLINYFADNCPQVVDRFCDAYKMSIEEIRSHPGRGSPKDFKSKKLDGTRSWQIPGFKNYLIFYQSTDDTVHVLAVTHGARDLKKLLRSRV